MQTRNRKPHDISRQCRSLGEIIIRKPDRCLHEDPRKITDCGLFSFYLAAQCKQGQASVSEGFSEAHTSRCFFISRCRPGCLGWWGPSVTHSGTSYEGIRLSHAAQVVQGLEVLFGAIHLATNQRRSVGWIIVCSTVCSNLFKDTLPPPRNTLPIHNHDYTDRIRDCFILATGILLDFDR